MRPVLRYPLIWLGCTAVSVGAVMFTVVYVAGTGAAGLPVSRTVIATAVAVPIEDTPSPSPSGQIGDAVSGAASVPPTASPTPSPSPTPPPAPTSAPPPPPPSSAPPAPAPTPAASPSCGPDAAVHTFQSSGGTATVAFGAAGVCLVTVVPATGFTAAARQVDRNTLVVTFSSAQGQSKITVTSQSESANATIENAPAS
ncbi:hypothetical protein ACIGXM_35355 [Kitasatospora sp. NPDC052896]|uniref:hypothetical protein n=1 Tax=Kitasatospora sp. NPDC052896 TaxID=3364061 RepID=UPI0037CC0300